MRTVDSRSQYVGRFLKYLFLPWLRRFSLGELASGETECLRCRVTSRPYTWNERSFYSLPETRVRGEKRSRDEDCLLRSLVTIRKVREQNHPDLSNLYVLTASDLEAIQDELFSWAALQQRQKRTDKHRGQQDMIDDQDGGGVRNCPSG